MNKGKSRKVLINLIWSIKELCEFNVFYMVLMIFESILKGILPVISLLLTQQMVNNIQLQTRSLQDVVLLLIILTAVEIFNELCLNYIQLKLNNYEIIFDTFTQGKILNKISLLDSKDFEDSSTYDLINRTQYDANAGILGNIKTFFSVLSLSISTISYIIIIIRYSIIISFIIILVPIIRYYFEKKYNLLEYDTIKKNTEYDRKSYYISYLLTNSEYFKEIKMFSLFNFFIEKYKRLKSICNLGLICLHNKRTITYSILSIIETVIDFFITLRIITQTFIGNLLIGQFLLYNSSINNLKQNMISIFSQLSLIYKNSLIVDQIKEFFELPKEVINEDGIKIKEIKNIRLENVSYKYSGKDKYTLKNISLTFSCGDFVVLMGCNGSGKSTLMKVIMGIYHDYEGDIYVDEINLKYINKNIYREKMGVLFQDYIKYETSISENILYGNLKYNNDLHKANELLKKVNLQDFLNQGNLILGYQFTDGRQISIGQWQKLALARTIIKEADLYIFDEPNSSLDLVSENSVLNLIYAETNKIRIIIMHRFNHIILKSNKIIVLKDGCVEEVGTHNDLLKNKGIYYELYCIQNSLM